MVFDSEQTLYRIASYTAPEMKHVTPSNENVSTEQGFSSSTIISWLADSEIWVKTQILAIILELSLSSYYVVRTCSFSRFK